MHEVPNMRYFFFLGGIFWNQTDVLDLLSIIIILSLRCNDSRFPLSYSLWNDINTLEDDNKTADMVNNVRCWDRAR